ncbi:MAG: hypothetical protein ACFFC1_03270 [Promethearchaeota archaeon]
METNKYRRQKRIGISLTVIGISIILAGILMLFFVRDYLRAAGILLICLWSCIPLICIGGWLWAHSVGKKKRMEKLEES